MTDTSLKIDPFHNQPDDTAVLYRYVTIDKLLDFLFSRRITLARLSTFADKLEGVTARHLLTNADADTSTNGQLNETGQSVKNKLKEQRKAFQESNYASCWYGNNHECVAMWQLYSKQDSVAIRIPYEALSKEIVNQAFTLPDYSYERMRYGSIAYRRFNELHSLKEIETDEDIQGFLKDASFTHEQEFRIIMQVKPSEETQFKYMEGPIDKPEVRYIPLTLMNFSSMPFEIVFHPQSSTWHRENIMKILDKFQLPFQTAESVLKDIFS